MLSYIMETVKSCGPMLLRATQVAQSVSEKEGQRNFVTTYDKQVQQTLRKALLGRWPEAHFMGEEGDNQEDTLHGLAFVVDPIDGTTNFIKGYRASTVCVAALQDGEAICGVVYDPYTDSLFAAEKGRGAWLNGEPIHVSSRRLSEGLVCLGTSSYYAELTDHTFVMARALFDAALDLRRSGSAALDMCYVACGRAELMYEEKLWPWDHAAAALIVREAGGKTGQLSGEPLPFDRSSSIVAGAPRAYDDFFEKGLNRL